MKQYIFLIFFNNDKNLNDLPRYKTFIFILSLNYEKKVLTITTPAFFLFTPLRLNDIRNFLLEFLLEFFYLLYEATLYHFKVHLNY
jgi:hypothetical protein